MKWPAHPIIMLDTDKFSSVSQVGGIELYQLADGQGRGVRVACVNSGAGLRYRVLIDRGLDIDHAFHNQHSLAALGPQGVTPPTRALDRGLDWLKGFPLGLLTSCGPFNIGGPCVDDGQELGLHGPHSNTAAELESVVQPDPLQGRLAMSITGIVRYGALYGPDVRLRRTIRSVLGQNTIEVMDEFHNAGNTTVPHAWLLHLNFGYPLLDAGAEFVWNAKRVEPFDSDISRRWFAAGRNYRKVPNALAGHSGENAVVGYVYPKPVDRQGNAIVGVVNRRLGLGVAVHYNVRQFPRCGNWQHWGRRDYVGALEPMNGTVDGRDKDRQRGLLDILAPDQRKTYQYRLEILAGGPALKRLVATAG